MESRYQESLVVSWKAWTTLRESNSMKNWKFCMALRQDNTSMNTKSSAIFRSKTPPNLPPWPATNASYKMSVIRQPNELLRVFSEIVVSILHIFHPGVGFCHTRTPSLSIVNYKITYLTWVFCLIWAFYNWKSREPASLTTLNGVWHLWFCTAIVLEL